MASFRRHGFLAALIIGLCAACTQKAAELPASPANSPTSPVSSLEVVDLKAGDGASLAAGQRAVVQYTGWLYRESAPDKKGTEFDSSRRSGEPFRFTVGAGQVIKGWDQGVVNMKIGGLRRLTIPADLAYGENGAGGVIPPGATLVFEVELVGIE
jgi:FKBP-type peptidyl-prolyl cis-trans isomerase FkpA